MKTKNRFKACDLPHCNLVSRSLNRIAASFSCSVNKIQNKELSILLRLFFCEVLEQANFHCKFERVLKLFCESYRVLFCSVVRCHLGGKNDLSF